MPASTLPAPRPLPFGFAFLTSVLVVLFFASIPVCWASVTWYGVDRAVASNGFYVVFFVLYAGVLLLPWLNLRGQGQFDTEQRLERMCLAWLWLEIGAAVFWSGPWLLFPRTIVAARGSAWAYAWWAYMDGGDARYTVTDAGLIAMEKMGIFVAASCAVLLVRRIVRGRFDDLELWLLMFVQITEFGVISVYYVSGFYLDLSALGGPWSIAIKYVGSNLFWFVMPPLVFAWAGHVLIARRVAAARQVR